MGHSEVYRVLVGMERNEGWDWCCDTMGSGRDCGKVKDI